MYPATLSRCSPVISGPISLSDSPAGPTLMAGMRLLILSTSASAIDSLASTTEIAMQRSPAEP